MKLYKVKCRGMIGGTAGTPHGEAYILAEHPTEAYEKLRKYLDENDLGFEHERELDRINLIAEEGDYPACRMRLFL